MPAASSRGGDASALASAAARKPSSCGVSARAPGLKDTVTEERKRRVSEARQKKALMRRFENKQRKLEQSREQRSAMAEKYGIRRAGS